MSKSCFQCKEMPIAKRRKVLTFRSWLKLAMGDVFLGHLSLFVSVIPAKQILMPRENGLNKMTEGKEFKIRGFPEAYRSLPGGLNPVFHILYDRGKEMAMCIE